MTVIPDPSAEIGQELYRFFVELLQPQNLVSYSQDRESYINGRPPTLIRDDAKAVLIDGKLSDIEANIALIGGTSPPIVICIVYPPWGT